MPSSSPHVIIIGAGITGLTLAQALRKNNISFTIFERDSGPLHRGKGWGLTIHWALDAFLSLLPQDLIDRIPETYVDPDAVAKGENGNFLFFDLKTGETRWKVPPARRLRVSRERLRRLLMDGIDIKWDKCISCLEQLSDTSIRCRFTDDTTAEGSLLVGCDGARSQMRTLLCSRATSTENPTVCENTQLPARLLGVSVAYPSQLALKIRALDPFFLQAGDPSTDAFFWFSFLDTPANNDREDRDTYECQILTSWPYRSGFQGRAEPLKIPARNAERLNLMRSLADGWTEPFREIVQSIPDDVEAKRISLEDWPTPAKGSWDNFDGKATLIGDAAHAMTMFRGEAGNHGILDIANFLDLMLPVLKSDGNAPDGPSKFKSQKEALNAYEEEMTQRTRPAVLRSRKACLDAHNYASITDQSPLVAKRGAFNHCEVETLG